MINIKNNNRNLLQKIINIIEDRDIVYALLTPSIENVPRVHSDVDLALSSDPRSSIEPILLGLQSHGEIDILQRLDYEVPSGCYYIVRSGEADEPGILCLDCLFDPWGISLYGMATPPLVAGRVKEWWGYRANDLDLAIYFWRKRAVKAGYFNLTLNAGQLADLQEIFARVNKAALIQKGTEFLGPEAEGIITALSGSTSLQEADYLLKRTWEIWKRRRWRRQPQQWLHRSVLNCLRLTRRLLQPTGLFVVLLGPDGCGKSTLSAQISKELLGVYRRTWRFHWRPGLLPKLSRRGVNQEGDQILGPPREAAYGPVLSLGRYLYYLADFVVGYWARVYPKKAATTLIIGERWYYDVVVNPQRYGFRLPRWLLRLGQRLVPHPDLVLLLTADPAVIHYRKPELSTAEIQAQIEDFRQVLRGEPVAVVDTGMSLAETNTEVREAILQKTAAITAQRLRVEPEWLGFGRGAEVKVWRHRCDQAQVALRLYQPASCWGRLAKLAAVWLPDSLADRFWFHQLPTPKERRELHQHKTVITKMLGESAATVSFATGTPGPHRKMVAQASVEGEIRAYIKIASGPVLEALLEQEKLALGLVGARHAPPPYLSTF